MGDLLRLDRRRFGSRPMAKGRTLTYKELLEIAAQKQLEAEKKIEILQRQINGEEISTKDLNVTISNPVNERDAAKMLSEDDLSSSEEVEAIESEKPNEINSNEKEENPSEIAAAEANEVEKDGHENSESAINQESDSEEMIDIFDQPPVKKSKPNITNVKMINSDDE